MRSNTNAIYHKKRVVVIVHPQYKGAKGRILDTDIRGYAQVKLEVMPVRVERVKLNNLML